MAGDLERINGPSIDAIFEAAVDIVQNMPKKGPISISVSQKLRLYSLFKQGTIGKCDIPCPPFWCAVERLKWRAWNSLGSLEQQAAKQTYIEELKGIINRVQCDYDIVELARRSDERTKQILKIKLSVLGYDLSGLKSEADLDGLRKRPNGVIEKPPNGVAGENPEIERHPDNRVEDSAEDECSVSGMGSDDEYVDAADCSHELHSCWRRNSNTQSDDRVVPHHPLPSASETETRNLAAAIHRHFEALVNLLTYIRRIIATFLSHWSGSLTQSRDRWKLILFVIVWPFIANSIMAYLHYKRLTRC